MANAAPSPISVTVTGFLTINGVKVPFTGTAQIPQPKIVFTSDSAVEADATTTTDAT